MRSRELSIDMVQIVVSLKVAKLPLHLFYLHTQNRLGTRGENPRHSETPFTCIETTVKQWSVFTVLCLTYAHDTAVFNRFVSRGSLNFFKGIIKTF